MTTPTQTIQVLQLTSPGTLILTTIPKPTLTPKHLLIKIKASSIQPSDVINASGGFTYTTYPRVPGRDFAGIVEEGPPHLISREVYGTSGNTQAFTVDGAQAEYMLVPEHAVALKPKCLSFEQAATIGVPFTTASMALTRSGAGKGDVVLVIGANGAVGSAIVQLATRKGCQVLTASRQSSSDINTSQDPFLSGIDTLTSSKGLPKIIDTVGLPSLTSAAISKLAKGGILVFIAGPRAGSKELAFDMVDFYRQEKVLVGVNTLAYTAEEFAEELKAVGEMFDAGLLKIGESPWTEVKLRDGVEAYEKAGKRGAGKFVIVMD